MKKLHNNTHDPYAQAIARLVKKTLLMIGVFMIVLASGIGFIIVKMNTKVSSMSSTSPKTELHVKTTPSTHLLGARMEETSNFTSSPSPQKTPQTSPQNTPTAPATSTSSPTQEVKIMHSTITALPTLDGYITQHGVINATSALRVGSTENTHIRSFISFDIKGINATKVKKAHLKLHQQSAPNNFFQAGARIKGDLIDYGSELDPGDYAKTSIDPSFILITNTANEGVRQIDITEAVMRIKNEGKSMIQIRLRVSDEQDYYNAYVSFESAENTLQTGNPPQLIIESIE